eukprot:Opistho-1_new@77278
MGIGDAVKYGISRDHNSSHSATVKAPVVAPRPVKPISPAPLSMGSQNAARNEILEILQSCDPKHSVVLGSSPPARASNPVAQNSPFCSDAGAMGGVELGLLTPSPPPLHKRRVATN